MSKIHNGLAYDCLDLEGKLDWLDGWHEEGDPNFTSKRDPKETRLHFESSLAPKACKPCRDKGLSNNCQHHAVTAEKCMEAGRMERVAARAERNV